MPFMRNRPAGQPMANNRIRSPETPEQAVTVFDDFYGQMPVPATQYAGVESNLKSLSAQPSVRTVASNASVVDRRWRRNGLDYTAGRQSRRSPKPQQYDPVVSSRYQPWLLGPQVNYVINEDWYIAYPAATVMLGGQRNMKWSTKVAQLPTQISGGPGPGAMLPAPRFRSVQTVPRYSTMPTMYNTQPTQQ